jgi:hypothetical protein
MCCLETETGCQSYDCLGVEFVVAITGVASPDAILETRLRLYFT